MTARPPFRIFYAHPASADPILATHRADAARLEIVAAYKLPDRAHTVTLGFDDWNKRFFIQARGDYGRWAKLIGQGRGSDSSPLYHAIVVPGQAGLWVGRATFQIVEAAVAGGREVLLWNGGEEISPVQRLVPGTAGDFKAWGQLFS